MTKALYLAVFLISVLGIHACTKDDRDPCLEPRTTVLVAGAVRHADTGFALVDTALPNPVFRPLTTQPKQYVYGGVKKLRRLTFSLSEIADSCKWSLQPDSAAAVRDTLTFFYQRQLHFLSNACGYTYFYYIDSVKSTRNAIDSLRLGRRDITTDANVENLKIIFR